MRSWKSFREHWDEEQVHIFKEVERQALPLWPERPLTFLERLFFALLVVVPIIALVAILLDR